MTHTEAGRYLRLVVAEEAPRTGDTPDSGARRVWEIAFGLAARRRFETDSPLAEIGRTVTAAVRSAALPLLEAEMLVREALGEQVPVDGIAESVRTAVHLLVFARLADELALTDDELDSLIAQAEELAAAGISPRSEPTGVP
ncbi:hypothetical protein [Actinoplanes solisilvae]|uniref:hypothetical protein n=1 Tax=Actinoplanes solisilvae TaxID=2486853 RepID=UPI000FDB4210|nr:hypothetical protein [Actinoplanes solisilvae]